jgi:ATP-dependent Zn protease
VLGGKSSRSRLFWALGGGALVVVTVVSLIVFKSGMQAAPAAVPFSQFLQEVSGGRVSGVVADGDDLAFTRTDGSRATTLAPTGYLGANPTFVADLSRRDIHLEVTRHEASRASSYGAFAIGMLFFGFAGLALYRVVTGRVPTLEKRGPSIRSRSRSRSRTWPGWTKRRTRSRRSSTS